jgi:hypothetical protein
MDSYAIRIGNLATLAKGDDRTAFEYLYQIVLGKEPESANQDLMKLADATTSAIIMEKLYGLHLQLTFIQTKTPDEIKKLMNSTNPLERQAALGDMPYVSILVCIGATDELTAARVAASTDVLIVGFNASTAAFV